MTYGLYPGLLDYERAEEKIQYLNELSITYLYKDILELSNIRNSSQISKLLKLHAFQVESLISINEIAQKIGKDHETVSSYIDQPENRPSCSG